MYVWNGRREYMIYSTALYTIRAIRELLLEALMSIPAVILPSLNHTDRDRRAILYVLQFIHSLGEACMSYLLMRFRVDA